MELNRMVKRQLARSIEDAVAEAQRRGELLPAVLPAPLVERPQDPVHGDFASGVSLKLSRAMRMSPLAIAERISQHLSPPRQISKMTIAPPGFINFTLSEEWLTEQVDAVLSQGEDFGDIDIGQRQRVQVEFVSANPTGPLHIGHGRGAVLGSTLSNLLTAAGYSVQKEFYLNDAGAQMTAFAKSLYARYQQHCGRHADMPPDGYFGNYMIELAREVAHEYGERFLELPEEQAVEQIGQVGSARILSSIRADLELLNVEFDSWFNETSLFKDGQYGRVLSLLEEAGYVVRRDDATWFESSALGEDKDNVLVRSDGCPTYFATDIAYHYNKLVERNFDWVIDIWGADHQGHVPRMKAVIRALNKDPEQLRVIICQLVTLRRGKEVIKVSKRSGDIVTLREVLDEVGPDPCRFVFLSRSSDSQMDFDIELAKKESTDNPVYYVQYAHARIASILKLAQERGVAYDGGDVTLLSSEPELALIRRLIALPEVIEEAVTTLQPHQLPYYAQDLATVFHSFYKQCRVLSKDEQLTRARLKLVCAAKTVLSRVLHLMGMSAPETM
ncbi:MAG: arginine--tRNA ligase [Chloroflexota bacterium]